MENRKQVFKTIKAAAQETGLSACFIRQGCKNGTIPHICSGCKTYVNVPAMLQKLEAESRQEMQEVGTDG